MKMLQRGLVAALLILAAPVGYAGADPGVTDKEIVIGSCAALEGPASFLGTQTVLGARAYLNTVNDQGGVHGRKIHLVSRNDGYEPDKAIACVNQLIQQDKVFAMGFFVGTPTGAKVVPMAEANKVPAIGFFTGAEILRAPVRRNIIHVRASYYDEAFAKAAGKDGDGVIITQVVPPPSRKDLPAVTQYQSALKKYFPDASPNFVSFEGFVNAMVLVEGLQRAGRDLTREKLVTAIEG